MKTRNDLVVYLLSHVSEGASSEDEKIIGVFSTRDHAASAIRELVKKPGFRDAPDCFHIDEYAVNSFEWKDGFGEPDKD